MCYQLQLSKHWKSLQWQYCIFIVYNIHNEQMIWKRTFYPFAVLVETMLSALVYPTHYKMYLLALENIIIPPTEQSLQFSFECMQIVLHIGSFSAICIGFLFPMNEKSWRLGFGLSGLIKWFGFNAYFIHNNYLCWFVIEFCFD